MKLQVISRTFSDVPIAANRRFVARQCAQPDRSREQPREGHRDEKTVGETVGRSSVKREELRDEREHE
jgi:hypothetical protein